MANYDLHISGYAFEHKCKLWGFWTLHRKVSKIIMLLNPNLPCLCVYSISKLDLVKFKKLYWTIHNCPSTQQNHSPLFLLPCFFDWMGDCAKSAVLCYLMALILLMIMIMNLFLAGTIVKDSHHHEPLTGHEQDHGSTRAERCT